MCYEGHSKNALLILIILQTIYTYTSLNCKLYLTISNYLILYSIIFYYVVTFLIIIIHTIISKRGDWGNMFLLDAFYYMPFYKVIDHIDQHFSSTHIISQFIPHIDHQIWTMVKNLKKFLTPGFKKVPHWICDMFIEKTPPP